MAHKRVIKACENRWISETCEGMFEGDSVARFCPPCRIANTKAKARERYERWKKLHPEKYLENSRRQYAEAKEIRKRLGIKGRKSCVNSNP